MNKPTVNSEHNFERHSERHSEQDAELAMNDGPAAFPDGPPGWPLPNEEILASLNAAYASGDWGKYHGEGIAKVERCVQKLTQQEHARLCSSGTIAVELALRAAQVEPGDEVILAGYDFPGNFRSIEACKALPVLVDVELDTLAPSAAMIQSAITPQTKAILVSHLHGGLAAMEQVAGLAKENRIMLIEDACQAPGAIVDGQPAGSWGDICVLSFGGSKLLTAGRGGAIATNHAGCIQRAKIFADRGNDAFPMSELQAAVLPCQFESLAKQNAQRQKNAALLTAALSTAFSNEQNSWAIRPLDRADSSSNLPGYYKYSMLLHPERFDAGARAECVNAIRAEGIAFDAGFRGFVRRGSRRCRKIGDLANAQLLSEFGVILHHPILLTENESSIAIIADRILRVTNAIARQAS